MSGFLTPPTFAPPVYNIPLGSSGQVLTMVGGVPRFASAAAASGAILGSRLAYASPAGVTAAAPVGFSAATGRLYVTLPGGDSTWSSLTAGADGQLLVVINHDVANILTLSAGGFLTSGYVLPPGHRALIYYDTTDASWELANG